MKSVVQNAVASAAARPVSTTAVSDNNNTQTTSRVTPASAMTEATLPGNQQQQQDNENEPLRLPHSEEGEFLSIVCGSSFFLWTIHHSFHSQQYDGRLFWRTTPSDAPDYGLYLFLADQELVYGTPGAVDVEGSSSNNTTTSTSSSNASGASKRLTPERAIRWSAGRRIPPISIYVVSATDQQFQSLQHLWKDVPSRLIRVRWTHVQQTLGEPARNTVNPHVDASRLLLIKAALNHLQSTVTAATPPPPCLVFEDNGGCLTYTATDWNGKIMGGAILADGMDAKLIAICEAAASLPNDNNQTSESSAATATAKRLFQGGWETMEASAMRDAVVKALGQGTPPAVFDQQDEQDTIMWSTMRGAALQMLFTLRMWLDILHEQRKSTTSRTSRSTNNSNNHPKPAVFITGCHCDLLEALLSKQIDWAVPAAGSSRNTLSGNATTEWLRKPLEQVEFFKVRNLGSRGLVGVLRETRQHREHSNPQSVDDKLRQDMLGQRVIVRQRGGGMMMRGTVMDWMKRGSSSTTTTIKDDVYHILLDPTTTTHRQGEMMNLKLEELLVALRLYAEHGDTYTGSVLTTLLQKKKSDAGRVGTAFGNRLDEIRQEELKKKEAQRRQKEEQERKRKEEEQRKRDEEEKKKKEQQERLQQEQLRQRDQEKQAQEKQQKEAAAAASKASLGKRNAAERDTVDLPAAKKSKPSSAGPKSTPQADKTRDSTKAAADPKRYLGRQVAKDFDGTWFLGKVTEYVPPEENEDRIALWNVEYEDGDREDFDETELKQHMAYFSEGRHTRQRS